MRLGSQRSNRSWRDDALLCVELDRKKLVTCSPPPQDARRQLKKTVRPIIASVDSPSDDGADAGGDDMDEMWRRIDDGVRRCWRCFTRASPQPKSRSFPLLSSLQPRGKERLLIPMQQHRVLPTLRRSVRVLTSRATSVCYKRKLHLIPIKSTASIDKIDTDAMVHEE